MNRRTFTFQFHRRRPRRAARRRGAAGGENRAHRHSHTGPASRSGTTLKTDLDAWLRQPLAELEPVMLYLDALALRVRSGGKVVSVTVLAVVGVLANGHKRLLTLELCGGESFDAWKGCLDSLVARGLKAPVLSIIDGHAGLRRAVGLVWPAAAVQGCCVHKLRNLERKVPKHVLGEVRPGTRIVSHEFATGRPERTLAVPPVSGDSVP